MEFALAALVAMTTAGMGEFAASKAAEADKQETLARAEQAYWDCEFEATEGRISLDSAAVCSEIFEFLKKERFGGDFEQFLVWWQQNKDRELGARKRREEIPPRYD